jgi:hypothetical protein
MPEVIIYPNPNGTNVVVCAPTGEIPIEEVLKKDCPPGAIIVDDSTLPQGNDFAFFDAWVLNGTTISVDMDKVKAIGSAQINNLAKQEALHRSTNTSIGVSNVPANDSDFAAAIASARSGMSAASTTTQAMAAIAIIQNLINNNVGTS